MQLLQRRNEQLGQEQGLQSNSLKKKNLVNRQHSDTGREGRQQGMPLFCWLLDCSSLEHFTLPLLCPQCTKQ